MAVPQANPSPRLIDVKVSPPATGAGITWSDVEPFPIPPNCPSPQQYPVPSVVIQQINAVPADTNANVCPPATGTGDELSPVDPFPSSPLEPTPQQ